MSLRLTETDKWLKDTWFGDLEITEKLLFIFIYENCDEAGFMELNWKLMEKIFRLDKVKLSRIMNNIKKCFLYNNTNPITKLWLRKFLLHQNKLPLDLSTEEGKKLYAVIKENIDGFNNNKEMQDILNEKTIMPVSGKRLSNKNFVPPKKEDFYAYYKSLGQVTDTEINNLYDYYLSVGWKVGKGSKQMVDWQASVRRCYSELQSKKTDQVAASVYTSKSPKPAEIETHVNNTEEKFKKEKEWVINSTKKMQDYIDGKSDYKFTDYNNCFYDFLDEIKVLDLDAKSKKNLFQEATDEFYKSKKDKKNNPTKMSDIMPNMGEHTKDDKKTITGIAKKKALKHYIDKLKEAKSNMLSIIVKKDNRYA